MGLGTAIGLAIAAGSAAYSGVQQHKASKAAQKKLVKPAPAPTADVEAPDDILKRLRKRKGQADTILTGDLVPMDIGKRTLLG